MSERKGFRAVFIRECRLIGSSKIYIWGVICSCMLSLGIMMFLMNEGLPHKLPIAVVDLDNTATSRKLIRQLDAFPRTDVKYKSLSFDQARRQMEQMEIYAFLVIPKNFTAKAQSGGQPKLVYYTNNAFFISGSLLFQDLKTISTLASASVGLQKGIAQGMTNDQIMSVVAPINVEAHPLNNPYLNYSVMLNNIINPCVLQLVILLFTVSGLGSEIKNRKGKELVELSGRSSWKMMLGKLLPNTLVFIMIALLYMSIFYFYNNFPLKNGFFNLFAGYVLMILAAQAMGVTLFCVFRNYRLAVSSASLMGMLAFSMVGFSFPSPSMSPVLSSLSYIYPAKYFFNIYGDQALNGIPIGYSLVYYLALMGFILVGIALFYPTSKILEHDEYEL